MKPIIQTATLPIKPFWNPKQLASSGLKWRIFCADIRQIHHQYPQKFDFIFGRPPYIRIHHHDTATRHFI